LKAEEVYGALGALKKLSHHDLILVTTRNDERLGYAKEWLSMNNALSLFQGFENSENIDKMFVCDSNNMNVMIDNDLKHFSKESNVAKVLINPYIDEDKVPKKVFLARNWDDVLKILNNLS